METGMMSLEELEEDYRITDDDDDEMVLLKNAVFTLNSIQRKIWLTYTEIGTYAGTAKEYGVSVPTIKKYIKEIREKIFENI